MMLPTCVLHVFVHIIVKVRLESGQKLQAAFSFWRQTIEGLQGHVKLTWSHFLKMWIYAQYMQTMLL